MKNIKLFALLFVFHFTMIAQEQMVLLYDGFRAKDSLANHTVLDFKDHSQSDLYKSALVYLKSIYNNPDHVISTVENEAIIINALSHPIEGITDLHQYIFEYNIDLRFKKGKIRFAPSIKKIEFKFMKSPFEPFYVANTDSPNEVEVRCLWMYSKREGEYYLLNKELNSKFENWVNSYLAAFKKGIENNDW